MEKFITAGDAAIRISDSGRPRAREGVRAPHGGEMTIVLLHGYLESLDVWDDFTRLLKPHMRVVAPDLPGHGISEVVGEVHTMEFLADTVHAALEVLNVGRCVVAGHSMGGYVALEYMRKYPENLAGMILVHSVPSGDTEEKRLNREREINIVLSGKKDLLAQTVDKGFAPENRRRFADTIADLSEMAVLSDDDGTVALLRGMGERRDMNEVMGQSSVPQLMIFGRGDEYIPADIAEKIIGDQPQARITWLEKSGHMGFVEEEEKTAETVIAFCDSLEW